MLIQENKDRDLYFDFLKGMLIFLVLLGHAIQYGNGHEYLTRELYWNNHIMKAVYSFHMPLFAAISGYFHFVSAQKKPSAVCANRWKRLIVPIAAWFPFVFVCKTVTHSNYPSMKSVLYALVTDYWFIWAILIAASIVYVVTMLKKRAARLCVYLPGFMLLFFLPDLLWVGAAFKYVIPFYVIGYEAADLKWRQTVAKKNCAMIGAAIWIILLCFYNKECYIYTSLFSISDAANPLKQFAIDIFRYAIGLVGIFTFCSLMHWIWLWLESRNGMIKGILLGMGQHSLAVYILSTPIYLYAVPAITKDFTPSIAGTLAVTFIVGISCMILTALIGRNKTVAHILLGE